jgi:VCBS repeat-containing protein
VLVAFHAQGTWSYALTRAQQEHIKHLIAGKTKPEALQLLASVPGIEQASIRWDGFGDDTRVPKNPTNIHLLLFYTGA